MAITNALTDLGNLTGNAGTAGAGYKVSNLYKQAYSDAVRLQIQQFDSLLSDTLQRESIEGEVKSFDRLDKKSVDDLLTRTRSGLYGIANGVAAGTTLPADAVYGASDTQRRMIEPLWFEYAELFDPRDSQGLMKAVRPDSQYLRNLAAIFNRKKDLIILDSLSKNVTVQQRTGSGVTVNKTVAFTNNMQNTGTGATAAVGDYSGTGFATEGLEIGCNLGKAVNTISHPTVTTPLFQVTATGVIDTGSWNAAGVEYVSAAAGAGQVLAATEYDASTTPPTVIIPATGSGDGALAVGTVTELNIEKLIRARQKLDANNALMPGTRYICLCHPNNFYSLMSDSTDTRFTSIDFNDGKPLTSGEAFKFMGFEFRITNELPQAVTDNTSASSTSVSDFDVINEASPVVCGTKASNVPVRWVYFYTEQCGIFGMNQEMQIRFDEIPERGYALQMWHQIGMNGLRMDGDCIVRVACKDEPA